MVVTKTVAVMVKDQRTYYYLLIGICIKETVRRDCD